MPDETQTLTRTVDRCFVFFREIGTKHGFINQMIKEAEEHELDGDKSEYHNRAHEQARRNEQCEPAPNFPDSQDKTTHQVP
jgi:hypothetical protein